jgi:hypothetical protein
MDKPNDDKAMNPGVPRRPPGHEPSQLNTAISLADFHSDHANSAQSMLDSEIPSRIKAARG